MISIPLMINITVKDIEEAKMIAHDLHDLLNSSGITNSVEVKEENIKD